MSLDIKKLEADLDKMLDNLTKEDVDQWKSYDKQRMRKEALISRLERVKAHLVRFEQWFAHKFGWFFSPKRYK